MHSSYDNPPVDPHARYIPFVERVRGFMRKGFSFPAFMGAALSAGAVAATVWEKAPIVAGKLFVEGDTWWHIVVGERILATHTWPTYDTYSFTADGSPWIAYEWLGELIMAGVSRLGGLRGLAVLLVMLSITFVLLLFYFSWLRCRKPLAAAMATAVVTPMAAACFTMRPQLFAYIFLLITLICLESFKQGRPKALWILPPLLLVWVNTHGSYVLGILAIGLYWLCGLAGFRYGGLVADRWTEVQRRQLLWVLLACSLAVTLTPYGTQLAGYPFRYLASQPYIAQVFTEWQPLELVSSFAWLFVIFLLFTLFLQVISPVDYPLEVMALLLFAAVETFAHARFIIFFALVYAPILATLLSGWLPSYRPDEDHPVPNAVLIGTIICGIIGFFPSQAKLERTLAQTYPRNAVEYLRQHEVNARTFNEDTWGGYLIRTLGSEHKVFIDGRAEIYESTGVLEDYIAIAGAHENALTLLRKYDIEACLIHQNTPLGTLLAFSPDWKRVYADRQSIIFARSEKESRVMINGVERDVKAGVR